MLQSGESGESGLILGDIMLGVGGKFGESGVGSAERKLGPVGVGVGVAEVGAGVYKY